MAWFVQSVTILWYAVAGRDGSGVERDRPWYRTKKAPTFADMLGALRLQLWEKNVSSRLESDADHAKLLDHSSTGSLPFGECPKHESERNRSNPSLTLEVGADLQGFSDRL